MRQFHFHKLEINILLSSQLQLDLPENSFINQIFLQSNNYSTNMTIIFLVNPFNGCVHQTHENIEIQLFGLMVSTKQGATHFTQWQSIVNDFIHMVLFQSIIIHIQETNIHYLFPNIIHLYYLQIIINYKIEKGKERNKCDKINQNIKGNDMSTIILQHFYNKS